MSRRETERRRRPHRHHRAARVLRGDAHVEVWEERDRLHVALYLDDTLVADWWDDDAREMFEDGFFERGRRLDGSVIEYALDVGLMTETPEGDYQFAIP